MLTNIVIALAIALTTPSPAAAAATSDSPEIQYTRTEDVIYDRENGTALTMDIFNPKDKPNGATVIWVVSGGWFSSHNAISAKNFTELISHGYRVCAVVHRSSPYFTIEHAIADVTRAIRFIRYQAAEDGHTSIPIGIVGGSAGGHLSLMAGATGDDGDPNSKNPVERMSSRVQAVACFFPPTDFLDYGAPNVNVMETTVGVGFPASFQFRRQQKTTGTFGLNPSKFVDVTDPAKFREILVQISPAKHVSPDDAPTLIIHGDADPLVPLQQSKLMVQKLKKAGVDAKLIIRHGKGHGWKRLADDNAKLAEWLDKYLL